MDHNCCKTNGFHTFDYKNNGLAYKNKGFVVLAHFSFFKKEKKGQLSDPGRRLDEPGGKPRQPILPRPPDGQKVVLEKKEKTKETLIFIS